MKIMRRIGVLLCLCMVLLFTGCGAKNTSEGKLAVYTSVYPVYDFAVKIAGEYANVVSLVPAGVEAHDFELGTKDMAMLSEADVFIYCGAGMEHWVDKTLETIQSDGLIAVEASKGVTLLSAEEQTDPHVWLAPKNAIVMMENIKNALVEADAAHKADYEANFEKYKAQLEALHKEYEDALGAVAKKEIIVAHASFGYLCDAYGLHQTGIEGLMADSEPDPATMKNIIDFIKQQGITTVFAGASESTKVVDTIADETGASLDVLDPIEGISVERQEAGEDYFSIMKKNLEALKKALQ